MKHPKVFGEKIKQNTLFGFLPLSKVDNIYGFPVLSVSRTKLRERGERREVG